MLINLTEIEKIKKHHIREQIQSLFQQKIPKRRELFFHIVELLDLKDKIGAEIGTSVCTFECESLVNAGMKQMTMVDNRKLPKPEDVKDNRIKLMKANARKLPFKKNH